MILLMESLFRPFHMHSMDNVSILFADIVGVRFFVIDVKCGIKFLKRFFFYFLQFTKMSAKKSAEQLVEILNDLFERFDDLW